MLTRVTEQTFEHSIDDVVAKWLDGCSSWHSRMIKDIQVQKLTRLEHHPEIPTFTKQDKKKKKCVCIYILARGTWIPRTESTTQIWANQPFLVPGG